MLGETPEQIRRSYGPPFKTFEDVQGRVSYMHHSDGYLVLVQFLNGISQSEVHARDDDREIPQDELTVIMSENARGEEWKKVPASLTGNDSTMQGWAVLRTGVLCIYGPCVVGEWGFQHALSVSTRAYLDQNKALTLLKRSQDLPLVRILVSETDDWLTEMIAELTHEIARVSSVATIIPPSVREEDLLETAAKQQFDVAVLLLNNIFYFPYDPSTRATTLTVDSVNLVKKMKELFKKPVIALYGWSDSADYEEQIVEAGAATALRIPCPAADIQHALKRCLAIS